MNCTEAQALLAVYRELKDEQVDTIELDVHLEGCASCRQLLARNAFIGKKLRSMPAIEPAPDMHAKFMRTLAQEHMQMMQQAAPGTLSTPEFLKPYVHEHASSIHASDPLAAFSTADTGPLPIIRPTRKRQSRSRVSQFAVLGIAASFLMMIMMGGIVSLLLLAHVDPRSVTVSVQQPSNIAQSTYTAFTPYPHVISAVADRNYIYYTATDDAQNTWVLERLDRTTQISSSILDTASSSPLVVLGSSQNWLVWLQFDNAKLISSAKEVRHIPHFSLHTWSLHYLSLTSQNSSTSAGYSQPITLVQGTFDQASIPGWMHSPVQGIWFIQNSLLVAMIDDNGISHLYHYQLGTIGKLSPLEIARANAGHIYTSPTANTDGSQIYWSEEWRSDAGTPYSNIWTQQAFDAPRPTHGHALEPVTMKQLFRSDGMSFHPQVVENTLFLLSTAPVNVTNGSATTPTATAAISPTPVPTTTPDTSPTSRVDPSILVAPIDESIRGTLLAFSLNGNATTLPANALNNVDHASFLQVGTDFALWQGDKGYEMYDASANDYVTVGNVLDNARLLSVNGDTAVWVGNDNATATSTADSVEPTVTLRVFNWPVK